MTKDIFQVVDFTTAEDIDIDNILLKRKNSIY